MRLAVQAGGEPAKAQRPKTGARKSRVTSKAARPGSSSAAREEAKVAHHFGAEKNHEFLPGNRGGA
jgi:hypothetical protein